MEDHHPTYFFDNNNNHSFTGLISDYNINTSSLGFMELLGFQDFCSSASVFELPKEENSRAAVYSVSEEEEVKPSFASEKSQNHVISNTVTVLNTPSTPNCSSISSEGHGDAPDGEVENHDQQNTKTKQQYAHITFSHFSA